MFQAFVITLREGIEAFLIIAISLAYLRKSGRSALIPAIHWGIGASVVLSAVAGYLFSKASNQALWEGLLAVVAAILVGTMTIQLWRNARFIKNNIEQHLEQSVARPTASAFLGVFLFTVLMMTREGMETALLLSTLLFQIKSHSMVAGALAGVLVAASLAVLWSKHGHRVNLGRFLQVTAIFLMVFVVQLLIYGFHELTEANVFPLDPKWHDWTEPFGPEGFYGQLLTYAMVLMPAGWLLVTVLKDRQKNSALPR